MRQDEQPDASPVAENSDISTSQLSKLRKSDLIELVLALKPGTDHDSSGESDARLIDAIENVSEGFAIFDEEDRLELCNNQYRDIYGYTD